MTHPLNFAVPTEHLKKATPTSPVSDSAGFLHFYTPNNFFAAVILVSFPLPPLQMPLVPVEPISAG